MNNHTSNGLPWWRTLSRSSLRSDLMAGLTGAVIALPQGVAFAMLAGLPPQYGLYTAIVPVIIAALFGSSHHLVSGPTTPISIIIFATLSPLALAGSEQYITLVLTLTLAVGIIQLLLGLARLGVVVNFISHSVIVGFTAGAAILIVTSQLKHIFGVALPPDQHFLNTWGHLIETLPEWNLYTISIASITLISALTIKLLLPRWPNLLIAMLIASISTLALGAEQHSIKLVGELPAILPPLSSPDFSLETWQQISAGALAIAVLGLVEAVSIARSIANRSHQPYDANREFIGQGLSNLIGSFFSSYTSSGSFTRSGLNYDAGAKTPLAAVFSALGIAMILISIAPLAAYLPISAMAGVLLIVAWNLLDFKAIKAIVQANRTDTAVLVTTFMATLFVELTFAIYIGILLSFLLHLIRISHPSIVARFPDKDDPRRHFITGPAARECPQLKILRIDGSIFFGSASDIEESLRNIEQEQPEQARVLIICSGVNFIDVSGAELLVREAKRRRAIGGGLYLCKVKTGVFKVLKQGGYMEEFGQENIYATKSEAITEIYKQLDKNRCERCPTKLFIECSETSN